MPKNTNINKKKTGTKFKIRISQLIAKILLKKRSLKQIRHCLTEDLQDLQNNSMTFKIQNSQLYD